VSLALSFNVAPLRPWEWANLAGDDARRWLETIAIHNAVADGIKAAQSEAAGWQRLQAMDTTEPQA
jgi:hypothetical protein